MTRDEKRVSIHLPAARMRPDGIINRSVPHMAESISDVAWREAAAYPRYATAAELRRMVASAQPLDRLRALWLMRRQIAERGHRPVYFEFARRLVDDPDNDCRWQALIVAGEFIVTQPEAVWEIVREYGGSPDADMLNGIACVLLEHLLEHDFQRFFPRVQRRARRDRLFGYMVQRCWKFGGSELAANARRLDTLQAWLARRERT